VAIKIINQFGEHISGKKMFTAGEIKCSVYTKLDSIQHILIDEQTLAIWTKPGPSFQL
jgi:hypothetical protein